MNVTLEVKVADIVRALSGKSEDPVFVQALQLAKEKQKNSQADFITLFGESFEEIDPNAKLATIFTIVELKDKIQYNSSNADVLAVIREEADGAIDHAFNILNTRINQFGVAQPNIQRIAGTGRILVELPGIKDAERVRKLLQGTAQLEFWETYEFSELQQYFADANTSLKKEVRTESAIEEAKEKTTTEDKTVEADKKTTSLLDQIETDSLATANNEANQFSEFAKNNPLYAYLNLSYYKNQSGQYVAAEISARSAVESYTIDYGDESLRTAAAIARLADVSLSAGNIESTKFYAEIALESFSSRDALNHPLALYTTLLNKIAKLNTTIFFIDILPRTHLRDCRDRN